MCDKANRVEKPELQAAVRRAAAHTTAQVAARPVARKDAVQVAGQIAGQATVHKDAAHKDTDSKKAQVVDPEFARAENEDDDGYDPYSDRRPVSEPLFERDPWS
mgnify:CR=1 FL=1